MMLVIEHGIFFYTILG